jgi:hypothetical protein
VNGNGLQLELLFVCGLKKLKKPVPKHVQSVTLFSAERWARALDHTWSASLIRVTLADERWPSVESLLDKSLMRRLLER